MEDSLFNLSVAIGGVVILVFAYDQFNRPSFEASRELERLIQFLKPSDFRNRRVFWQALAAYAALLLLIYVLICTFFTEPMLAAMGLVLPEDVGSAQSPVVPLTISLAMVGLAPAIKPLQQFEQKIRLAAHRLSGIPGRLVQGCRRLQTIPLGLPRDGSGLLLTDVDWQRLAHCRRLGKLLLDDPANFAEDMAKVLAYRAWILRHGLGSASLATRPGIERSDAVLKARIDRLVLNLDILLGSHHKAPSEPAEASREAWEALAAEADELCADVCAMLMLRLEHGLIADASSSGGEQEGGRHEAAAAQALLARFVGGAERWVDHSTVVGQLWLRATLVALPMAALWGVLFGAFETGWGHDQVSATRMGLSYAVTAATTYSLAVFVALAWHDHALRAEDPRRRWPNMATTHWTRWMGPAAGLFFCAWGAAAIAGVAVELNAGQAQEGTTLLERSWENYWPEIVGAFHSQAPATLLGAVLALGVVASIDVWRAGDRVSPHARWVVLLATTAALAALAPALHALALQYQEVSGFKHCPEVVRDRPDLIASNYCEQLRFTGWGTLVEKHAEKLRLIGLRAGLIGAAVLYVCQATLAAGFLGRGLGAARGAEDEPFPPTRSDRRRETGTP